MSKRERLDAILEIIGRNEEITVPSLSEATGVSIVTIRKDLQQLEKDGRIRRTYGKIFLSEKDASAPEEDYECLAKRRMGQLGAAHVSNEELIFLGPGHTCVAMAEALRTHQRLSVITMNVSAAMALADAPEIKLLTLPGDFTRRDGAYYVTGTAAMDYARDLYVDKMFITADGFDLTRGYSVMDEITANIYRALIKPSTKLYIFVTSGRLKRNARAMLGNLDMAHAVITDRCPDESVIQALKTQNVKIYFPQEE